MSLWYLDDIGKEILYYARGRDALWGSLDLLGLKSGDVILVPSYLCAAVIQPLKRKKIEVRFYQIKKDLTINIEDLGNKICPKTKAVLIIHYFGFPQAVDKIMEACRRFNLFLIEDCAHVLMSKFDRRYLGGFGDAAIFSFKKTLSFLPGNGAALLIDKNKINLKESALKDRIVDMPKEAPPKYFYRSIQYFILQYKTFRFCMDKIIKLTDFTRLNPNSQIRKQYLDKIQRLELTNFIAQCRDNFIVFLNSLTASKNLLPVFTNLPPDICPLGFPIFVNNRDGIFKRLLRNGIRPFILWEFLPEEIDRNVFKDADYISRHILIFPLSEALDVERISKIMSS